MENYERLTYRQIAERMGITPDAARMKAKREAKAGRWRLIHGNHPSEAVHVDVPVGTLVKVERPEPSPPTPPTIDDGIAHALLRRCEELTNQLLEERSVMGRVLAELAAAEARELGTAAENGHLLREVSELRELLRRRRRWWGF